MDQRTTLTLKRKAPQEAPQQPKKKNKADVHAKKKQHRIDRIAKHWTLFSEPEAKPQSTRLSIHQH